MSSGLFLQLGCFESPYHIPTVSVWPLNLGTNTIVKRGSQSSGKLILGIGKSQSPASMATKGSHSPLSWKVAEGKEMMGNSLLHKGTFSEHHQHSNPTNQL